MSITSNGIKLHNKRKGYCCAFLFNALELVLSALLVVTLSAHIIFPEQARGAAGVSNALSYQGRLTDTSGNPLGGSGTNYCLSFSIFDASSGGNKLWPSGATTTSTLMVTNGVFNTSISPVDSFDFSSNDTTYLNVDVYTVPTTCTGGNWEALSPRQQLNAVAYARVAADVYGSTLQTDNANNKVQIGPAAGAPGNPTLLNLGTKTSSGSSFTTVGQSCAGYNGAIWYNSATTRALVCEANTVRALSNATTTIDAVMPAGNLDVAATAITNGTFSLAGGNNITLSQAGNAITIRGAGGGLGALAAGTQTATSGTINFANSNNISFGMSGSNQITASAAFGGVAGSAASTVTNGVVQFSNLNGISFGLNGSTMSASYIPRPVVVLSSNTAGVMATISSGTMTLAGGNNITLSQNGNAVTIIGAAGGAGVAGISAGTFSAAPSSLYFSNANGVSFGLNSGASSSVMTASHNGLTTAMASNAGSDFVQANANFYGTNASGTIASNAISVSVAAPGGGAAPNLSLWQHPRGVLLGGVGNITNITALSNRPFFIPVAFDGNITLKSLALQLSRATSGSNLFTVQYGLYTYANSTRIDLRGSCQETFSNTATASVSGIRALWLTCLGTHTNASTVSPGNYVLGFYFSAANTLSMNYSIRGQSTANAWVLGQVYPGANIASTATSQGYLPMFGRYSNTHAAPIGASYAQSQIIGMSNAASLQIDPAISIRNF